MAHDGLSSKISTLSTAVQKLTDNADIHVAHAHAAKELGAGKEGGLKSVCQQANCNGFSRAPPWRKNHLYKTCFVKFRDDESAQTLSMKGGKTMTKGPPREGATQPTCVIGALFFQHRPHPGDALRDFTHDFNAHRTTELLNVNCDNKPVPSDLAQVEPDVGLDLSTFTKLDLCAAMSATTMQGGFFGTSADVRFLVNGVKSPDPFMINESQPFGMLMIDDITGLPFIACHGGMLKASEDHMTGALILSTNQMSDAWVESASNVGARAHLADHLTSFFEVAGGRQVRTHRRNSHPGVFCRPITPADPKWHLYPRVWVSEDAVHQPKDVTDGIVLQEMTCNTEEPFLSHPVTDAADPVKLNKAVGSSLHKSEFEMGEFQHLAPLPLSTPKKVHTLEARWGGHNVSKIQLTLENVHGGSEVLSAKGKEELSKLAKTKFRHLASRFRTHETKKKSKVDRQHAKEKKELSTLIIEPGDAFDMDIYPSGATPPCFHVIKDHVVDMGWVHGLQSKAGGDENLLEHTTFATFTCRSPFLGTPLVSTLGGKWIS
jgi:hypothetical protein